MHNELIKKYQETQNSEILNEIILQNKELFEGFAGTFSKYGYIEYDDALSCVYEAFIVAANKFDPTKNTKFTTYLYILSKQNVIDFIRKNNLIVLPISFYETYIKYKSDNPENIVEWYKTINSKFSYDKFVKYLSNIENMYNFIPENDYDIVYEVEDEYINNILKLLDEGYDLDKISKELGESKFVLSNKIKNFINNNFFTV